MNQHFTRDTVLLSGWLFADLLLGLMMIFLVSIQGAHIPPVPAPTLTVTPTFFKADSPNCQGGIDNPQCVVTVGESQESVGAITWHVSSDISDTITYSPSTGTLKPGETMQVRITTLPCQNGSFTFTGTGPKTGQGNETRDPNPVTIRWQCTSQPVRLDTNYHRLHLSVDYQGLLNGSQSAISDTENQIRSQIPAGVRVGLAIVYDGASDDSQIQQAFHVDAKIYQILVDLGNQGFAFQDSSYYNKNPLFTLGPDSSVVKIDVFYFTR